jgi:hypothetical protein
LPRYRRTRFALAAAIIDYFAAAAMPPPFHAFIFIILPFDFFHFTLDTALFLHAIISPLSSLAFAIDYFRFAAIDFLRREARRCAKAMRQRRTGLQSAADAYGVCCCALLLASGCRRRCLQQRAQMPPFRLPPHFLRGFFFSSPTPRRLLPDYYADYAIID